MKDRRLSAHVGRQLVTGLLFALIPLMLLGIFVSVRGEFAEVRYVRHTAEETAATRQQLANLLVMHIDAETAVRGFVLSGDERFLEPYNAAVKRREAGFAILAREADPQVRARLGALRRLSDAKLANAARNIADVRAGRPESARLRIASGRGRAIMDTMRREIGVLDEIENHRLTGLLVAGSGSREGMEQTVMAMLIGLAALLGIVTVIMTRLMRKRAEALDRAERSNERQNAMFDGAVDGMLLLDENGNILRMNPSISRMFGYSEEDLVGRHNMFLMQEDYTPEQSLAWLHSVGAAGEHGAGRRQEFTGQRNDGSTFETEVAISRLSAGDDRCYIAAVRDISAQKRAEKMKNEFVSTVSHELRTPLTSIGGSLGLLSAGAVGELNEQAKRLVAIAYSNCERLIRLINDILDIEKIESGQMEFDLRRMQVAPLVQRTMSAMTGFAEKHDVKLTSTIPPWPQCVTGDPDRLEQLLTNLVSNAIKHSPKGGEVEIFSDHHEGMVRVEVRDRGPGVPEDFRSRIFGKFAMADASDSRIKGGTGLGLSIAREIARRHGGDVGYEDRDGGGTAFHFDIPAVTSDAPSAKAGAAGLPVILHLDGDEDCLSVVRSAFDGRATVRSVATLFEAREAIRNEQVDAAIIDIGMGGEDGTEIIPLLRLEDPSIPVVLFTAIDVARGTGGADKLLVKSRASIDDLVAATMRSIAARKRRAA